MNKLYALLACFVLIGSLSATTVNESINGMAATPSATDFCGSRYLVGATAVNLTAAYRVASGTSLYFEVWSASGNVRLALLKNISWVSGVASIPEGYMLNASTAYIIGESSGTATFNIAIKNPGTYPIAGTFGNYTNAVNNNASQSGYYLGVVNITVSDNAPLTYANLTVVNGTGNATQFETPANRTISANAITDYTFNNWTITAGNCTVAANTTSTTANFLSTTSNCTVQANYIYAPTYCNTSLSTSLTMTHNAQINSSTCFNITAPNIVLDCNGYSITGNNSNPTFGVYSNQNNTTIKNCNISNFTYGVALANNLNANVSNLTILDTSSWSGSAGFTQPAGWADSNAGMLLYNTNRSNISRVKINTTGVSNNGMLSIEAGASNNTLNDINVTAVTTGKATAILMFWRSNNYNNLSNMNLIAPNQAESYGIAIDGASYNRLVNFTVNGGYSGGLAFESDLGASDYNMLDNFNITANVSLWNGYNNNAGHYNSLSNFNMTSINANTLYAAPTLQAATFNNFTNGTFSSPSGAAITLTSSANSNIFKNITFIGNGANNLVGISSGTANVFELCNFTNTTTGYYVNDAAGSNFYNSSTEGNIWADVVNGSVNITGNVSSSISGYYIGFNGTGYPYNSTHSGKITSNVVDNHPLTPFYYNSTTPDTSTYANLTVLCGTGGSTCLGNATNLNTTAGINSSINATAAANYTFSNFSITTGNCTLSNTSDNTTTANFLNTTTNCVITANFTAITYTYANLTVVNGTGSDANFTTPANKTITANAITNYTFMNWSVTFGNCTLNNSLAASTIAIFTNTTSNCTAQANFNYTPLGNISVSCGVGGASCTGNDTDFLVPANKTVNETPSTNYLFSNWSVSGDCSVIDNSTILVNSGTCLATANFILNVSNITADYTTITPNPVLSSGLANCEYYHVAANTSNTTVEYEWYKNFYLLLSGTSTVGANVSTTISSINNSSFVYDDLLLCQVKVTGGAWVPSSVVVVKIAAQPITTYSIPALISMFWNTWSWLFVPIFCLGIAYIVFQPSLHTTMLAAGVLSFVAFALSASANQTNMMFIYEAIAYFALGLVLRFSGSK